MKMWPSEWRVYHCKFNKIVTLLLQEDVIEWQVLKYYFGFIIVGFFQSLFSHDDISFFLSF